MPERPRVNLSLDLLINRGGLQGGRWHIPVINLLTILATWSTPTVRAIIGKIESGIMPKLRDQMQAHLSYHLHRIVMTEFTIEIKYTTLKASPICSSNRLICSWMKPSDGLSSTSRGLRFLLPCGRP